MASNGQNNIFLHAVTETEAEAKAGEPEPRKTMIRTTTDER